ncbi:hypothetical protein [Streptomyces nanshensis]|uniref:Uncharacterized protein n=1 Tax=Streptomyces nanshensis TaxID=518642 RepID=A0A1E7LCC8_9ACTN|nr:hypothetical protein [Streptomyces nanshensis]OEV13810.1 hypothetical protein AN218_01885 [Streptomyces nanshensis]
MTTQNAAVYVSGSAAARVLVREIEDRRYWAQSGCATHDARNEGVLNGLYMALDALGGAPHPTPEGGRQFHAVLTG